MGTGLAHPAGMPKEDEMKRLDGQLVGLRVDAATAQEFRAWAAEANTTVSALLRDLVRRAVARHRAAKDRK